MPPPVAAPRWDEPIVKMLASSGFSLVSLAFAAFTFLFGALIGLRTDTGNEYGEIKSKLAIAIYWIAGMVIAGAAITVLANLAIAFSWRAWGLISIGIACLLLLAIPSLVVFLAYDVFRRRSSQ
jgi:hypothetical protein